MVDSLSGFIRIYIGIENPLFNIGYWVRGPILIIFIFYYFLKIIRKNIFYDEAINMLMFLYFILNAILHYIEFSSINMLIENITYVLRFQFLLFLFVFIKNRMIIQSSFTQKVIYVNFGVFVINLLMGHIFGIGLESYRFEGTSKGMFQGGNPVSILNLIFFTYFLLDKNLRRQIIPLALTFFNAFVIASKSVFGFIIPIFFALKRRALSINKILAYNLFSIILIFSFSLLIDRSIEMYESRFGLNITKSIAAAEKVGGLYSNQALNRIASINFRRYASLNIQIKESFSDAKTFWIGKSFAGQNLFWKQRGEFWFTNASMDFFDFFFKYGVIGIIIFLILLLKGLPQQIYQAKTRNNVAILLFFAYSFFGGHVIDSATSGSLFYFLLASMKS
ncbi:MAG: hypothetical protein ACJZ12_01165 [Candidatus Neomarinimicrobiota bacterium]